LQSKIRSLRYFIEFSYNGKNYFGYQIQPNQISVQEVLEHALSTILREEIRTTGAGRTDTGVHARRMFAHFDTEKNIDSSLAGRLNSFLPADIAVKRVFPVREDFHARFDAIYRTYEYCIVQAKDPFTTDFAWQLRHRRLNIEKMNEACRILMEYEDFSSFEKTGADNKTSFCKIYRAHWEAHGELLKLTISADRFLRNMVRAIVGTMVDIGSGKTEPAHLRRIVEQKSRTAAGSSAPPQGLFLVDVGYDFDKAQPAG